MMLAALCGEHLLLLGPPGTAKSELSRRLSGVMGGKYFERLLTRFSVPEELFGPLSMKGARRLHAWGWLSAWGWRAAWHDARGMLSAMRLGRCGSRRMRTTRTAPLAPHHTTPSPHPQRPHHPPGLENDEYVRQTEGYLPTAEVAFVDEIFKANSAILNALLTLLNERLFDNGNQRLEAPLMCLIGASNELPESEELDALYDRFLLRRSVAQVSNSQVR